MIVGAAGERTVGAADFFTGVFQTAVGEGELLTEIRVPKLDDSAGSAYVKFHRRAQDWATVGVAAVVRAKRGRPSAAVALTNMAGTTIRATAVEEAFAGGASPADAAAHAAEGTEPSSDTAASAEFRKHLARVLTAASARGGARLKAGSGQGARALCPDRRRREAALSARRTCVLQMRRIGDLGLGHRASDEPAP